MLSLHLLRDRAGKALDSRPCSILSFSCPLNTRCFSKSFRGHRRPRSSSLPGGHGISSIRRVCAENVCVALILLQLTEVCPPGGNPSSQGWRPYLGVSVACGRDWALPPGPLVLLGSSGSGAFSHPRASCRKRGVLLAPAAPAPASPAPAVAPGLLPSWVPAFPLLSLRAHFAEKQ